MGNVSFSSKFSHEYNTSLESSFFEAHKKVFHIPLNKSAILPYCDKICVDNLL